MAPAQDNWGLLLLYGVLAVVSICFLFSHIVAWTTPKGLKRVPKALVLPFVGDSVRFFQDGPPLAAERFGKLGPVYETWILGEKNITVGRADLVKFCLNKEHDLLEADWPTSTKVLLGANALAVTVGDRHLQIRKILRPAFTIASINEVVPRMAAIARRCCDKWAAQGRGKGLIFAKDYTFSIALELILGFDETLLTDATIERCTEAFGDWNEGLFSFPVNIPGTSFHKGLKAKKILMDYLDQNLKLLRKKQHRGTSAATQGEHVSCAEGLLDIKDDEGNGLNEAELKDLFLTLLFAGHDTSASSTMRLFSELPRHPHVWERLIAEQRQVVAKHGPQIDGVSLKTMTYADVVVKEILRLHPIVGGVFRRSLQGFDLGGYHIPKGRKVFLNMGHSMQNDERWMGEAGGRAPWKFCPERWLDEAGQKTGAWTPFGGGSRMCLGYLLATAELKVLLALWAREYEWHPLDINEPFSFFPLGGHPVNGLLMDFQKLPEPRIKQTEPATAAES